MPTVSVHDWTGTTGLSSKDEFTKSWPVICPTRKSSSVTAEVTVAPPPVSTTRTLIDTVSGSRLAISSVFHVHALAAVGP